MRLIIYHDGYVFSLKEHVQFNKYKYQNIIDLKIHVLLIVVLKNIMAHQSWLKKAISCNLLTLENIDIDKL